MIAAVGLAVVHNARQQMRLAPLPNAPETLVAFSLPNAHRVQSRCRNSLFHVKEITPLDEVEVPAVALSSYVGEHI
jgi:hypothetical protein